MQIGKELLVGTLYLSPVVQETSDSEIESRQDKVKPLDSSVINQDAIKRGSDQSTSLSNWSPSDVIPMQRGGIDHRDWSK